MRGLSASSTLDGPPDRMMALGLYASTMASALSNGWISQ